MSLSWTTLIIFSLALLPALAWIMVYRYLDSRDPEPRFSMFIALLIGMCSTAPVFGLQLLFSNYPDFDLVSFFQSSVENPVLFSVLFLTFVAVIEELFKALAFISVVRKNEHVFNQIVDGIVYGALIGIGFALAENVYYFYRAWSTFSFSSSFVAIFAIRSFGTMLAHSLFAGLFGFYFAKAYFAPFIDEESKKEKLWHNFHRNVFKAVRLHATFFHLLPGIKNEKMSLARNALIFEGFFIAVSLHFIYNALIKIQIFGSNWTFLIVPLIFIMSWYVWSRFFVKIYILILDFIRDRRGTYKVKIH